jgi:HAD superfamily hydrolase (TIGR01548 family)
MSARPAIRGVIFDMDGVLAEVGASYRECIVRTAAHFGHAAVTPADITALKALGGFNNDWLLTQRLLRDRGIEADIDAIAAIFDGFYDGDDTVPGLHKREALLVPAEDVQALSGHGLALAVATGRPIAQALRFLADHGLDTAGGFDPACVVGMEHAKSKPDPEPLNVALERVRALRG